MRLLFVTHRMPFPPDRGDKIRSFNLLRHLSGRHDVSLACVLDPDDEPGHEVALKSLAVRVATEQVGPRARVAAGAMGVARGRPLSLAWFYSGRLQAKIDEWIDRDAPDAVLCYSSPTAEYVLRSRHARDKLRRARRIMDLIDVDSRKWREYADADAGLRRPIYRYEAARLAAYERRLLRCFDHLLLVTAEERALLAAGEHASRVRVVENGVDLAFFAPCPAPTRPSRVIVFTGVMSYRPNADGARWFVERVLPRVREAHPDAEFRIVGKDPTPAVRALGAMPGVVVTGAVSDVRVHLAEASVCVAPLLIARGIQNKVLEAMAMGRPVVATREAYEGIRARAGEELLVASDDGEFAHDVIALLGDPARASAIGAAARRRVERDYAWDRTLRALDELLLPGGADAARRPVAA